MSDTATTKKQKSRCTLTKRRMTMYYIMKIENHYARVYKKTKSITKAHELVRELRDQGIRAYYIKKENNA